MTLMEGRTDAASNEARAFLPGRAAFFYFLVLSGTIVTLAPLIARLDTGR